MKGKLIFQSVLQGVQEYGTGDDCTVSRVEYYLETPEGNVTGIFSDVKQTPGGSDLEVSLPEALAGVVGYDVLRREVEEYYFDNVGPGGRNINLGPGSRNIIMRNNRLVMRKEVEVELIGTGKKGAGW